MRIEQEVIVQSVCGGYVQECVDSTNVQLVIHANERKSFVHYDEVNPENSDERGIEPRKRTGLYDGGVLFPTLLQLPSLPSSLPSKEESISKWPSKELMEGLNIAERREGDQIAVSLSGPTCSVDCEGERKTGDGERLKPTLGEGGLKLTSVKGDEMERWEGDDNSS